MSIYLDLSDYWYVVAVIVLFLTGVWGFKRLKTLFTSR